MKSLVAKRSVVAAGHKTSVSLEDAFWEGFKEIARGRNTTLSELVAAVDSEQQQGNHARHDDDHDVVFSRHQNCVGSAC